MTPHRDAPPDLAPVTMRNVNVLDRSRLRPVLVFVMAVATVAMVLIVYGRWTSMRLRHDFRGNYSGFLQLGRERFDTNPLVMNRPEIRRSVDLLDDAGYDGQFMYYMTFDPFMRRFDSYRSVVDYPPYRFGRIGFSLLTKLASLDRWRRYPETMVVLIIGSLGLAAAALAALGSEAGAGPLVGALVLVVPGFWESLGAALPEPVAAAGLLVGFWLLVKRCPAWAGLAFAVSLLVRETGLILIIAAACAEVLAGRRRGAIRLAVIAIVPLVLWRLYVGWSLHAMYGAEAFLPNPHDLGLPFAGIADLWRAIRSNAYYPDNPAVARAALTFPILLIAGALLSAALVVRAPNPAACAALAYAVLAICLNFDGIWSGIGGAVRDTFELFVALAIATTAWRSYSPRLRLSLAAFWTGSAACVFLVAVQAASYRQAAALWAW